VKKGQLIQNKHGCLPGTIHRDHVKYMGKVK